MLAVQTLQTIENWVKFKEFKSLQYQNDNVSKSYTHTVRNEWIMNVKTLSSLWSCITWHGELVLMRLQCWEIIIHFPNWMQPRPLMRSVSCWFSTEATKSREESWKALWATGSKSEIHDTKVRIKLHTPLALKNRKSRQAMLPPMSLNASLPELTCTLSSASLASTREYIPGC